MIRFQKAARIAQLLLIIEAVLLLILWASPQVAARPRYQPDTRPYARLFARPVERGRQHFVQPYRFGSPSSTLDTSLIAYWKLDEESGTRVDAQGANDLTDNNTVLFGAGIITRSTLFI